MTPNDRICPGPIALFGSGETAPSGQKIFDFLFRLLPKSPLVKIIETPAGFELNSEQVAGNVADFLEDHLRNYKPRIELIPARKKGTPFSPDDPEIVLPILESDLIFMGPGSPTYAVKQLVDSLAWEYLITRHRQGAGLALSSATTVAISSSALPVYEIYKVGMDLHWQPGLDFFKPYGVPMIFIPHWNNQDGGKDLDTSRCYMGKSRFDELVTMLPGDPPILGIDENTGLVFNFESNCLHVVGLGNVTILRGNTEQVIRSGKTLDLQELGDFQLSNPLQDITQTSWDKGLQIQESKTNRLKPSQEIIQLAEQRETARKNKQWEEADAIRERIESLGWSLQDNPDGFQLEKRNTSN